MTTTCKNCGQNFKGNFCNNCGQSADTQELNFKFLRKNVFKLLFKYFDKGILFTSKQLFTRPGNAIREYIDGKRVNHFEPFALLVTLATLYGFFFHYFHINLFANVTVDDVTFSKISLTSVNEWMATHFSLATIMFLPFYTVGSFLAFRKQGYNIIEHLVLNAFLGSQRLLLRLATFPLLVIFNGTPQLQTITRLYILCDIILMTWSYCQFFNKISRMRSFFLSLLSYAIFFTLYFAFVVLAFIVAVKIL